jgi:hypothetical protein
VTVEVNGEQIGLELTGIFDQATVAEVSIRERVCKKAEAQLKATFPETKLLINVVFDPVISKALSPKTMLPELIAYLEGLIKGERPSRPEFLRDAILSPQHELQIVLAETYSTKKVDVQAVEDLITQKETKLDKYKVNSGLEKIWLLVIIDGASEKSDPIITPEILPQRKFAFDRIIVFDTFKQVAISYPPPGR